MPKLETEMTRWGALLHAVPASDPIHDMVMTGALQVRVIRQNIEMKLGKVRGFCLAVSTLYAGLLLWTCHAAGRATDGWPFETASILGILPAVMVGYLNLSAGRKLAGAGTQRRRFERDYMQGTFK